MNSKSVFSIRLLSALCVYTVFIFSHLCADTFHSSGWTVTAGIYNDSHIVDGIVSISGNAIIDGDLIVHIGEVNSGGSTLTVHGDLIVSDSRIDFGTGGASLTVDGNIHCEGDVEVRNDLSAANITAGDSIMTALGEITVPGNINCGGTLRSFNKKIDVGGDVVLSGTIVGGGTVSFRVDNDNAYIGGNLIISSPDNAAYIGVYNGDLKVQGDIKTLSPVNNARIDVGYDLFAGSISTYGNTDAYVKSENGQIIVSEDILTHSITTTACVWADGDIVAHDISTYSGATSGLDKNVSVSSDTGEIKVAGDIITKGGGGAASVYGYNGLSVAGNVITDGSGYSSVRCQNGSIDVSGAVKSKSSTAEADVYALNAISVGDIVTSGYLVADVYASNSSLIVQRDIKTYSQTGNARVYGNNTKATNIVTDGYTSGIVFPPTSGYLIVSGDISTHSPNGPAYIKGDYVLANNITISAGNGLGYLYGSSGRVEVMGDINMSSKGQNCDLHVNQELIASNITTNCVSVGNGNIYSVNKYIDVKGDIVAYSADSTAKIYAYGSLGQGYIRASNITTSSDAGDAYIRSPHDEVNVSGDISTNSFNGLAYVYGSGGIKAGSIVTTGSGNAIVDAAYSPIIVKNNINTYSSAGEARIHTGCLEANNITTDGYGDSYIRSIAQGAYDGCVNVRGDIETKSSIGQAHVRCDSYLSAKSVKTSSGSNGNAYILSVNDYIDAPHGINTYSAASVAYVKANKDISTDRIVTKAIPGQDCSIKSETGSVKFTCTLSDISNSFAALENAYMLLDEDITINKSLTFYGMCTINGEGGILTLGSSGQLDVAASTTLLIQNTKIIGINSTNIRGLANDSTLWLRDCELILTNDYTFGTGSLICDKNVVVSGEHNFEYTSVQASYIYPNSTLMFDYGSTLLYNTAIDSQLTMNASTSKLLFNSATLQAQENINLTKGIVRLDNTVTFSAEAGKQIALGDGASTANNITLEFHSNAKIWVQGDFVDNNV